MLGCATRMGCHAVGLYSTETFPSGWRVANCRESVTYQLSNSTMGEGNVLMGCGCRRFSSNIFWLTAFCFDVSLWSCDKDLLCCAWTLCLFILTGGGTSWKQCRSGAFTIYGYVAAQAARGPVDHSPTRLIGHHQRSVGASDTLTRTRRVLLWEYAIFSER